MIRQKVIICNSIKGQSIDEFGEQVRYQIVFSSKKWD